MVLAHTRVFKPNVQSDCAFICFVYTADYTNVRNFEISRAVASDVLPNLSRLLILCKELQ